MEHNGEKMFILIRQKMYYEQMEVWLITVPPILLYAAISLYALRRLLLV